MDEIVEVKLLRSRSSVRRILGGLDMLDREQEGMLRVKTSETQSGAFDFTFAPNFGGDPRAARTFDGRKALETFLSDLGVYPKECGSVQSVRPIAGEVDPSPVFQVRQKSKKTGPRLVDSARLQFPDKFSLRRCGPLVMLPADT
jgi:hypothetical protein